jgi:predicted RNase H-like nuclease (RuvC/YqgF family)
VINTLEEELDAKNAKFRHLEEAKDMLDKRWRGDVRDEREERMRMEKQIQSLNQDI